LSTLKFGAQNEQWSVDAQLIAINAIRRQLWLLRLRNE
jgi:hypothetical protein